MTEQKVSFFTRLALAWRMLFDGRFAAAVLRLSQGGAIAPAAPLPRAPEPLPLRVNAPDSALQMLGLLQQEGRFVDFLEEDVSGYSDGDIGGAARVVHEGCRKALHEHFSIEPVRTEAEGSRVTLEQGFDASAVRLTGNVVGQPPFTGTLAHRGWRAAQIRLPKVAEGHDIRVLAPAEVEL